MTLYTSVCSCGKPQIFSDDPLVLDLFNYFMDTNADPGDIETKKDLRKLWDKIDPQTAEFLFSQLSSAKTAEFFMLPVINQYCSCGEKVIFDL